MDTTETPIIDLDHYSWRKPFREGWDDDQPSEGPIVRYLIPHGNPMRYEDAVNQIFDSADEARVWLEECEYDDEAREEGWVIVHVVSTIVGTMDEDV